MSRFTSFVDAVHARLDDSTVTKVVGAINKGKLVSRRHITWFRDGGAIEVPDRGGAGKTEAGTVRQPSNWNREEVIVAQVYAESDDTFDLLFDNVIASIDKTAGPGSVIWQGYESAFDEYAKRGVMAQLTFSLKLPVADEIKQLVTITAEELECKFDEDL